MTSAQLASLIAAIQASGGTSQVHTNATRAAPIHHRTGVAAPDLLATPVIAVLTDVPGGGGLAFTTNYKAAIAAGNSLGTTVAGSIGNVTTSADALNTHAITIPVAQTAGATVYHIFLSVDAAPKYVAQITEAQRAAGCTVTAMGTVTGTSPGAGVVQVNVVGTGVATGVAPFASSTALNPVGITPIDCTGYSKAHVFFYITSADLRVQPSLTYTALEASAGVPGTFAALLSSLLTFGGGFASLQVQQVNNLAIDGSTGLVILIDAFTGQGMSIDVWVELE